jgi:hemolysin activation/secretion protein
MPKKVLLHAFYVFKKSKKTMLKIISIISIIAVFYSNIIFAIDTSGTTQSQSSKSPNSIAKTIYAPKGGKVVGDTMSKIDLVIADIKFSGNTKLKDAELEYISQNIKKTGKLSDAYEIAQAITIEYRKQGFILSRAIVPEQNIENGILKINIIEGYVDDDKFTGLEQFKNLINILNIKASIPLKAEVLERELLLLKGIPGLDISSVLTPSTKTNASNLIINVGLKKISGGVSFDNHGTKFMGPLKTTVDLNLNSVFGIGSSLGITGVLMADKADYSGRELKSYDIRSSFPLGHNGTRINASHSHSLVNPGHTISDLDVESKNNSWSLSLSHPLIRQRVQTLSLKGGFNYKNLYTNLLQKEFTKDRVRSIFTEINYDYADNFDGTNLISFKIDKGFSKDSATQENSLLSTKPEANPNYTKFSGRFARNQSFSNWCENDFCNKFSLFLSANWQFSDNPLLSSEEFSIGGRVFGKAYDLGEISGDKGVAANVELHFKDSKNLLNYDIYSFLDFGTIRNIDLSEQGSNQEKQTIRSAGIGVVADYKNWNFALEIAKPLTEKPATQDDKDSRIFAQIGYKF